MHAGVLALTLLHILPHAGKTTNIPEGTAVIHSAMPLMTAEEQSPQLSVVRGEGLSVERVEMVVGDKSKGVKNKGRGPIRLLTTQRVGGGLPSAIN